LSGVVAPVLEAFEDTFRVSRQVLWGNVASGLASALGMLAAARPDRAEIAAALADRLLDRPPLRGTGELVRPDLSNLRRFFVRRSCCMFYRVPGAGMCADCVLTPEAIRLQQWQDALSDHNCDL
jgi:ferric iron reductase protein FhuF